MPKTTLAPVVHRPRGIFKLRDTRPSGLPSLTRSPRVPPPRRRRETQSSSSQDGGHRRDIASDVRLDLFFCFLLFLGILGRRRRMRTRFYLVRVRTQEDHLYYASSDEGAARRFTFDAARENQYEGACSHTLCGCYPSRQPPRTAATMRG